MSELVTKVVTSTLFWITLCQWSVLTSLVTIAQRTILKTENGASFLVALIDLLIMFGVSVIVLAGPLFLFGLFPIPIAEQKVEFFAGVTIGAVLSIAIRKQTVAWLERRAR